MWGERTPLEIESNELLKLIDFPVELRDCYLNNLDFRNIVDSLYHNMINALCEASIHVKS